tara:strand:- start:696 stop:845 length:150 start_codon:yes stop_codon:yes gene_type:complete
MKKESTISEQIAEAYRNYHSPWTDGTEKGYWWKKIQELSKKRLEKPDQV